MEHQSKKTAAVIIPTYNEEKNIAELIERLEKTFKDIPDWRMDILIVDDASPDGTANTITTLQKHHLNLHLLTGPKRGIGEAYKRGFRHAINTLNPEYIFQLDADLQHDPADIPKFLHAAAAGYEFIIGSRYIPGGDCPNWEFKRKMYSWLANVGARILAGIKGVNDCTSGYRCIKTDFLEHLQMSQLKAKGYPFQISLLHAATKKHLKIIEIPIHFHSRKKGESKMINKDILEFFFNAIALRFRRYSKKS